MSAAAVALRVATRDDIPFIMATERQPGFELLVSRWSEDEHLASLAASSHAYLVGIDAGGERAGFAIIRDLDDAHGNVCLKRIAVARPGAGFGGGFFDWVFCETQTHRLWLDVLADNARARHVYASHGMSEERVLPEAYALPNEKRVDLVVMSMTRPEWTVRGRC